MVIATAKVTTPKMNELTANCEIPLIIWPLVHPPARRAPNSNSVPPVNAAASRLSLEEPNCVTHMAGMKP